VTPAQLEDVISKKILFASGLKLFNEKAKKGIAFFIKNAFVEDNVDSIVQFLKNTTQLSKAAIGDYISEGDEFNKKIRNRFIDGMNFSQIDFVQALRDFLQSFRLPGEAQKIDRLMEKVLFI
jgi:brefeldin A-inhibited guanine nucleotide-exchange protein